MSYSFRQYCVSLKTVNIALKKMPITLDPNDLTVICGYLQSLLQQEEKRLIQTGWIPTDIIELKQKAIQFWEKYKKVFKTDIDFFNYSFSNDMNHFLKIWSFNQFFGILHNYLENPNLKNEKTPLDEPYSKIFLIQNLYLGFYENFLEYLSYFIKPIYQSDINPNDRKIVKGGLIFRVFFRQYCRFSKYDEVFDYKMRNWIAHHNFIMNKDKVCVLYYSKYPRKKLHKKNVTLNQVNAQLMNLASVTIIIMTLFDQMIFDMMNKVNVQEYQEMAKYFKNFFSCYFESWEQFGKLIKCDKP